MASMKDKSSKQSPAVEPKAIARGWKQWLSKPWTSSAITMLLTAVVAGRGISDLPLRFDEFFSLTAVVTDPRNSLTHEGPIFPYYGLLWLWSLGGQWTSDVWLRSLSLLAVVMTAALMARIAGSFAGVKASYIAGLLFALNPGVHFVAQDARPYAVGMFLFTWAAYALLRGIDEGRTRSWIAFAVILFVATLTMPNGLLMFVPLTLLYSYRQPGFFLSKPFLLTLAPTVLLVVSGIAVFAAGISTMRESLPNPVLSWIPTGVIWTGIAEAESYGAPGTFAAVLLLLAALTARGRRVLWGVLGSVLLVWVLSQWPASHWMGRTFVSFLPLVSIAAAFGVAKMQRRQGAAALVVAVLFALPGYTAVRLWGAPADLRLATQIIEREAKPTDQIFGDGYLGQGRAFELAAGLEHYGSTKPPWEVTAKPTREFWLLYGDFPCEEIFSQDVLGGMNLRKCAAPR